jgi:hypothetical protein
VEDVTMFDIQITGLDKLQRDLEDAQRAFESLDGTITTLTFDPADQASIDTAIREMASAIDAKVGRYSGNALVESVAAGLKEKYRTAILERAAEARSASAGEAQSP